MPDRIVITPELVPAMLLAHRRWKAGITSQLEAGIEQMEAILLANPNPNGNKLVTALKAFNDGDETKLNQLLFGTDHYPFPR